MSRTKPKSKATKEIIEIDEDSDDSDSDESDLAEVTSKIEIPALDEIDKKTLRNIMSLAKGSNPKWCCPVKGCGVSGQKVERMIKHAKTHRGPIWEKMVGLHLGQRWDETGSTSTPITTTTTSRPGISNQSSIAESEASEDVVVKRLKRQTDMQKFCVNSMSTLAMTNLARLVTELSLPMSLTESAAMHEFCDELMKVQRMATSKNVEVSTKELLRSRKPFTKVVDQVCEDQWNEFAGPLLIEAKRFGCTLIQDGRSNVLPVDCLRRSKSDKICPARY
jgi:hypothetical protein